MKKTLFLLVVGFAAVFVVRESYSAEKFKGLPHGGTPVRVGGHGYHLELVRDAEKGTFRAYVLDAHVERYVAVPERAFEMVATIDKQQHKVTFQRVPETAHAELPATSHTFEGRADWIKTATNFNAVLPSIALKGRTFTNITFSFPKGTIHRAH